MDGFADMGRPVSLLSSCRVSNGGVKALESLDGIWMTLSIGQRDLGIVGASCEPSIADQGEPSDCYNITWVIQSIVWKRSGTDRELISVDICS